MSGLGLVVPEIRLPADYARLDHFADLARRGVAGFVVYRGDDELLPAYLAALRRAAGRPLLFMSDVECGVGQQVAGCVELPPLLAVGATGSVERAYQHGRCTALEARRIGLNVLLGPVVDVLSRLDNPIVGPRSFGSNPELVGELAQAWIQGAQDQGVLACAKHFPGHGHTRKDSHEELPIVHSRREDLERRELVPFVRAVRAGVASMMTAHVAYPGLTGDERLPATLSAKILRELLRERLGFGGLVISDALSMTGFTAAADEAALDEAGAAVAAVAAGCDLLLGPRDPLAVAVALESAHADGEIDLLDAQGRLLLTVADLPDEAGGDPEAEDPADPQTRAEHRYVAYGLARDSVACLNNEAKLLPLDIQGRTVMVLVVDDDDEPERVALLDERRDEFTGGYARRTSWTGRADPEDAALLVLAQEADVVLLPILCATRAYKGRPGLRPELARLVLDVLDVAPGKTVCLLLGGPATLAPLGVLPPTVVCAWGGAPVCLRAALDTVLTGSPLRGVDPSPPESV